MECPRSTIIVTTADKEVQSSRSGRFQLRSNDASLIGQHEWCTEVDVLDLPEAIAECFGGARKRRGEDCWPRHDRLALNAMVSEFGRRGRRKTRLEDGRSGGKAPSDERMSGGTGTGIFSIRDLIGRYPVHPVLERIGWPGNWTGRRLCRLPRDISATYVEFPEALCQFARCRGLPRRIEASQIRRVLTQSALGERHQRGVRTHLEEYSECLVVKGFDTIPELHRVAQVMAPIRWIRASKGKAASVPCDGYAWRLHRYRPSRFLQCVEQGLDVSRVGGK